MNSTNPRPPRWADWLLEKLLHGEALEEVQGDLHESFLWRLEDRGKRHAKWQFVLEILQSIRFSNLKPYPMIQQLMTLFTSYIKTGWRFIIKSKGYAAINILGLSIGMVFSWFAYQYSVDQYTYDQHIDEAENLYNMIMAQGYLGTSVYSSGGSYEAAHRIVDQIPEVVDVALFAEEERILNLNGNTVAQKVFWNNATLANLLNLKILEGKQGTFDQPDQVIISERMALKLGVRGEALDHTLKLFDSARFNTYQIIGVYQNLPSNSTINPDIMLPLDEFLENKPDRKSDFGNGDLSILLKFKETSVMAIVNEKVNRLFEAEGEGNFVADISPFSAYHLGSSVSSTNGFAPKGDKEFIGFIAISGLLCLLISIINYANLSVSIHINRSREVAVRKVMGAARMGIFLQLMIEAFLSTMLAVIVALIIYHLASPTFSDLVEKTFDLSTLLESRFIPGVVG
ncbi:MAG: permease prefix domain 2-containing transporter [Cytophagales bacterium]|nr:permease prefix domain 2-containing transporter [Cytophagales bacterium]